MLSRPEFEKNSCEIRKEISKTCRWGVGADYMQVVKNGQDLSLADVCGHVIIIGNGC